MKSAGSSAPSLRTTLRSRMVSTETPLRTAMRPSMMSARSRQPAALPEMRQSGPASRGDPTTIGLATAPPSNLNLNDVQSLLCRLLDYADHWLKTGSGGGDRCVGVGINTVPPKMREACRSVENDREWRPLELSRPVRVP